MMQGGSLSAKTGVMLERAIGADVKERAQGFRIPAFAGIRGQKRRCLVSHDTRSREGGRP